MPLSVDSYLIGPLVALALVSALGAVLCRAVAVPHRAPAAGDEGFGLLRTAALADDPPTADRLRDVLAGGGVRSTSATGPDGRIHVLVFADELATARRLVGTG